MASPAASLPDPASPPPDPQAIRASLTPVLAAEFDREWDVVRSVGSKAFGPGQAGHIVYLIQQQQEVHPLLVQWWG